MKAEEIDWSETLDLDHITELAERNFRLNWALAKKARFKAFGMYYWGAAVAYRRVWKRLQNKKVVFLREKENG